jgi:phospholipid/cholesterol/gamma-HCH transport system substrate-binding protein
MDKDRIVHALTGAIALILFSAAVYVGVLYTNGDRFKSLRSLYATFDAAGQGLQAKSDVKIHGVTIGAVKYVKLANGQARVKMVISRDQQVPKDSLARIKPKTLFGEKFVDIVPKDTQVELTGPFLKDGDTITQTAPTRGTELEDVLAAAYPILAKIDPDQLTVVLDTLAEAGRGEGPAINRQLGNFQSLADVAVAHDLDTQQLLSDFALLSSSIADDSPNVVALAKSLNIVLPQVNTRGDEITSILANLSRLSNDTANLLDANRATQDKLILEGGQVLSTLIPRLSEVDPTIVGIRQFVQMLTEIGHVPYGPGTVLGAIKLVLGGGCPFGQVAPCTPTGQPASKAAAAAAAAAANAASAASAASAVPKTGAAGASAAAAAGATTKGGAPASPTTGAPGASNPGLPQVVKGVNNLLKLVGGLLK